MPSFRHPRCRHRFTFHFLLRYCQVQLQQLRQQVFLHIEAVGRQHRFVKCRVQVFDRVLAGLLPLLARALFARAHEQVRHTSVDARANSTEIRELLTTRLNKLRAFYQQGMPQSDWRMYSTIDTRFADQVVCTRRADYRAPPKPKPATATSTVTARNAPPQDH